MTDTLAYPRLGETMPESLVDEVLGRALLFLTDRDKLVKTVGTDNHLHWGYKFEDFNLSDPQTHKNPVFRELSEWCLDAMKVTGNIYPTLTISSNYLNPLNSELHRDNYHVSRVAFSNHPNWRSGTIVLPDLKRSDFKNNKLKARSSNCTTIDPETNLHSVTVNNEFIPDNLQIIQPDNGQLISLAPNVYHAEPRWPEGSDVVRVVCVLSGPK